MRKITSLLTLVFSFIFFGNIYSQDFAIVGYNGSTPDGLSIVALTTIAGGSTYYMTDNEWSNAGNAFNAGEGVYSYTVPAGGLVAGDVINFAEAAGNTFNVACDGSIGACGTAGAILGTSITISATGTEALYIFSASNGADPLNTVTSIHGAIFRLGTLPADEDPRGDYPTAIMVQGFTLNGSHRQYTPSLRSPGPTSRANLENPANYDENGSATYVVFSTTRFANINLAGANPVLTVSAAPASVAENSGSSITYTFTLDAAAAANTTVNFNVSGTATFSSDYTQSGAATFNATSGTVVINSGATTAAITITPVGDTTLEGNETAILTAVAGTGYDVGVPSGATGTINNDDTQTTTPMTAVVGLNENSANTSIGEAFSFVALDDIPAGTTIYFTEEEWSNNTLAFATGTEAVVSWSSAAILPRGEVVVVTESTVTANTFTTSCNGGSCGTATIESGSFALSSTGEGFYSYTDTDNDPTNGVTQVDSVLFTGPGGGAIPSDQNPASGYLGAVVVDGFPAVNPQLTEYNPALRGVTVDQANFQNTGNWLHMQTVGGLSTVPFADIIIATGPTLPVATLGLAPTSVVEDSGTPLVFTFSLSSPASGDTTINFDVAGSATLTTDYTQSGAATFGATSGTVVIQDGTSSTAVNITPVVDTDVEPTEMVELTITSGTGYNVGTPNDLTGDITNDDTSGSDPLVAMVGVNHDTPNPDGISFVAVKDIPAGTEIYFTDNEYDSANVVFNSSEMVLLWTSPGVVTPRGDVIVITETAPNILAVTCSGTGGIACGTAALQGGTSFTISSGGETTYAYEDTDIDPTNGVVDVYSALHTIPGAISGLLDPRGVFLNAIVVDGFTAAPPDRTEYDPTLRGVPVDNADFENTANWINGGGTPPNLSTVPFADIMVVDTNPPTAVCQDITVQLDSAGSATIVAADVDNGSSDAEGPVTLSIDIDTFDCTDVPGPVTVTLTVTDAAGNTDTCTSAVTVEDNVAPTAICQDITVQLDASGNASIAATDVDNGSNDACGIASLAVSPNTFDCTDVGNNTVTLTVTDNNGNTSTCTSTVTVEDNIAPTALCQDVTVQLDASGNASVAAASVDNGSNDACGIASLSLSPNSFDCTDVGNNTVTLTATDNNGNISTCTATVTVEDNVPPVAICQDITVQLDASGNATIAGTDVDNGSNDACGIASLSVSPNTFDCTDIGNNTVTLTVTDNNGNTSTCTSTVTVEDNVAPTALCQDITVQLDASGNASITAADVDNGSNDACGIASLSVSPNTFDCTDVGNNTVTLTVTDNNGNISTCTSTVTVEDNVPPVAICQDITIQLDAAGNATISATDIDNGSNDACGIASLAVSPNTFDCSDLGANTVTLTVTDNNGNVSTCTSTVTVEDVTPPVITCPADATVECGSGGSGTSGTDTAAYTGGTQSWPTTSTGLVATLTADLTGIPATATIDDVNVSFDIDHSWVGDLEITLISPDNGTVLVLADPTCGGSGNSDNVSATLDDESGVGSVSANCTGGVNTGGGSDTCPADYAVNAAIDGTFDPDNPLSALDGGTAAGTWTLEVVDDAGGDAGCIHNFSVEVMWSDASGGATDTSPAVTGTATAIDTCDPSPVITFSDTSVAGCGNTEIITRTWTATDASGNTDTCVQTITVVDTTPPVPNCPADITVSNDPGVCGAVVTYVVDGTDNCGSVTVSQTGGLASGSTFPVGTTTNTFTLTDECGNTSTCSFDVTVNDTEDPVVSCPADITVGNDPGMCDAVVTFTPTATDNCPGVTVVSVPASGSVFPVGTTLVTVTATDASGNTDVCTFNVTVNDTEAPVISCPADATVECGSGMTGGSSGTNTASYSGGTQSWPTTSTGLVATLTADLTGIPATATIDDVNVSFDIDHSWVGDLEITLISPDNGTVLVLADPTCGGSGNSDNVSATLDDESGVGSVSANCTGGVNTGGGSDTCPADYAVNAAIDGTFDPDNPLSALDGGTAAGTWTLEVVDDAGGDAGCIHNFSVEVTWTDAGVATTDTSPAVTGTATATDNCDPNPVITFSDTSVPGCGNTEIITRTWTATDADGNSSSCTQTITVVDTTPPVPNCPADITVSNDPGVCGAVVTYVVDGTDNCGSVTVSQTGGLASGSTFPVGTTTNTFTLTDECGNTSTCSFDVTVIDNEPPLAICQDITVQLDVNGDASITAADVDGGSTDNCGIASLSVSPDTFDCSDVGPNVVTLTVTDVNGNSSTCTSIVTVEDNIPPVAVCQDITLELDAAGNGMITPADVDGGSTDACGIASLAIDIDTFDCSDVGPNNVTLTVTDVNGNVSTCVAVVTVVDVTDPIISCPADIVTDTNAGVCDAIVTFPDAIAFDECGIDTVVQTAGLPSGSVFPLGVSTIEFTATDVNGNTSVCSFTITVEDNEAPMAVCEDITIELDATGVATITAADVDGGSTDNCGVITDISIDVDTFDCSDLGDNPVVLSVTDDNGNTGTCTAIVTVIDVTAPDAVCMDITVELDAAGMVTIGATQVDGGSTDACGIDTYAIDIDTFTCADVGDNTVTLTVTDASGNSSSCTATVTVEDVTDPVVTCMDIIVGLDENGVATITASDVIESATDACGIDTAAVDITEFSCDDLGAPVEVNVFVTDVNGNLASCTALVTVKDGLEPIITCPEDQTVEVTEGTDYELPDYFAIGEAIAIDNCTDPVVITTQDPAPGTLLPEGVYTITLTAEDDSGNVAICDFELTVLGVLGDGNNLDISTIVMYPNPATVEVRISNPMSIELDEAQIFDLTGKLVGTYDLRDMGTDIGLDISKLQVATYTVIIKGPDGQLVKQLIKE